MFVGHSKEYDGQIPSMYCSVSISQGKTVFRSDIFVSTGVI